jgi:hypothetical protein
MLLRNIHGIDIHTILEPALLFRKFDIIPTHLPLAHPTILRERPVFETIASLPFHSVVLVLVLIPELDRYLIVRESEQLFTQAIRFLLLPFGGQEVDDGLRTDDELVTITPDGVVRVRFGQDWAIRVARWYVSLSVPKILSFLYFCPCGLLCEGRCERHGVMVGCINCRLFVAVYSAHGRQNNTPDTACFCHLCFIETRGRCQLAQLHDPCPNGVGDRDTSGPSE